MVLGIASTAMPFARTPQDQAERWLRLLRLHGQAGVALQSVGVGEGPLRAPFPSNASAASQATAEGAPARGDDRDMADQVAVHARRIAAERGLPGVTTAELLLAVMRVYGAHFDSVLQAYGTDRAEVIERLGSAEPQSGG